MIFKFILLLDKLHTAHTSTLFATQIHLVTYLFLKNRQKASHSRIHTQIKTVRRLILLYHAI